ncbi:MAG: TolC family protein [Mangrovibacterium sp.]
MNGRFLHIQESKRLIISVSFYFLFHLSYGQTDLKSLLDLSGRNYPSIAAKQEEAEAAKANVSLEKNSLLPSLDASYQANYATYNNITGMSYPGQVMPISGPPSDDNYGAVPGSAASLLFKWSPVTFGQRSAAIAYNEMQYEKQLASVEDEVLKVKFKVAYLYLEMAATEQLINAWQKNIERNAFNLKQVSSLVSAGLRPAVDSLKFKGELSKAKTQLFELQNLLESQKQQMQELLVSENLQDIEISSFFFSALPHSPDDRPDVDSTMNPLLKMAELDLEANQARLKQIKRSWTPKLEFWGTTYARGSGISFNGTVDKAEGWSFSRYNYGLGLQMTFPLLDLPQVRLQGNRQEALIRSAEQYLRQTKISVGRQETTALNELSTSLHIAAEVPVEYKASESAYRALQARYNSGLVDYTELIRAQYDLLNAEARLKNASVRAWQSLLKLAIVRGDVSIFLNQIEN